MVDDEPETLAAWGICCERDGFEVKAAGDGQAALAVLTATAVDIVVADWRMPIMSGSALCQHIRNTPGLAGTVFILVSAEPSPPAYVYAAQLVFVAEGQVIAEHVRCINRSHDCGETIYDWRHYLAVLQRKPGALRNGAPFAEFPAGFKRLQAILLKHPGGDREMVVHKCRLAYRLGRHSAK